MNPMPSAIPKAPSTCIGWAASSVNLALSELLIAHESIESFLDEMEGSCSEEMVRQRDRSAREFREGKTVSWEKVKLDNGL
jgi:hypothetical protein